jgi:hypothetical protein
MMRGVPVAAGRLVMIVAARGWQQRDQAEDEGGAGNEQREPQNQVHDILR